MRERGSEKGGRSLFFVGCIVGLAISSLFNDLYSSFSMQKPTSHPPSAFIVPGNVTPVHTSTASTRTTLLERETRMNKYINKYNYAPPTSHIVRSLEHQCGDGPDFEGFFNLSFKKRSRLNEDKTLYNKLFKNVDDASNAGTYIELGAFDGSQEANTRFFDVCLGWKGLLIEGNPENFQKVIQARPNAHRMSFAPSCSAEYEAVNETVPFYRYPMTNVGLVGKALTYTGKPTVDVPCGPLTPVLQDVFEGERISLFVLDVEGSESLVLDTIDFEAVMIEVMMIEVTNNHCGDVCPAREEIRAKMKAAGYQKYEGVVHASDVYVHPRSRYQMP
jgi:hypothetical protein